MRFTYAVLGHVQQVVRELANGGGKLAQSYQYNWVGQATQATYPEGTVVGYGYTMRGNLEKVYFGSTAPGAGEEATKLIATWSGYDARGNPGSVKYGVNGANTVQAYDEMGHLTAVQITGAGKTMQDLVYDWYRAPNTGGLNLGRITDNRNPAASEIYQYDDLYRLTQATGVWGTRTYSYDTAGNATAFGGLVNRVLSFNGQQLQSITSNGVTGAVEHDLYGNLTSKQEGGASWKYRWTTENFLESVEKAGAVVATMTYDAWGQRATKQSPTASTLYFGRSYEKRVSGGVAEETIYLYGNGQLIAHLSRTVTGATALSAPKSWGGELAAASMYDGRSLTGAARKMYHWVNATALHPRAVQVAVQGLLLLFAAAVLAWLLLSRKTGRQSSYSPAMQWASLATLLVFTLSACGGEGPSGFGPAPNEPTTTATASLLFYHRNQVSSTTLVTDSQGREVARYVYLPFGEKDAAHFSGADVTKRKFTSQERDEETGLDYFNARYYDPAIGRFISADTIIPDVMNGMAFNRYAYVNNNPVMFNDPTGHVQDVDGPHGRRHDFDGLGGRGGGIPADEAEARRSANLIGKAFGIALDMAEGKSLSQALRDAFFGPKDALEAAALAAAGLAMKGPASGTTPNGPPSRFGPNTVGAAERIAGKVVQTGGSTIGKQTANALNKTLGQSLKPRDWGRALEDLKADLELSHNFHGKICSNGDYMDSAGNVLGNLADYL